MAAPKVTVPQPEYIETSPLNPNGFSSGFGIRFAESLTQDQHYALETLLWSIGAVDGLTYNRRRTAYGVYLPMGDTTQSQQALAQLKELLNPVLPLSVSAGTIIPQQGKFQGKPFYTFLVHDPLSGEEQDALLQGLRTIRIVRTVRTETWHERLVVLLEVEEQGVTDPAWLEKHLKNEGAHATLAPDMALGAYAAKAFNLM
ncbi:MAG TPA: hypothetical protein VLA88_04680 [Candidatus Saccharimonadales bacterium]|nr:hypothetical protein [Candidatus Saccharimonadales bacterium]